jgi:hypothetical protein
MCPQEFVRTTRTGPLLFRDEVEQGRREAEDVGNDSWVELICFLQGAADDPVKWLAFDKVVLGCVATEVGGLN